MKAAFTPEALDQLSFWIKTDARMARKILELIELTKRDPYAGIGKPEPLKHNLGGCWSRRITEEHRLVYRIIELGGEEALEIIACGHHYRRR